MNEKDISALKVVELKAKLTELGLPTNGLKAVLVERLVSHFKEQSSNEAENTEMDVDEKAKDSADDNTASVTANNNNNDNDNDNANDNNDNNNDNDNNTMNDTEGSFPVTLERQLSKNAKKRNRRKKKTNSQVPKSVSSPLLTANNDNTANNVEIEYVAAMPEIDENDPLFAHFADVLKKFDPVQIALEKKLEEEEAEAAYGDESSNIQTSKGGDDDEESHEAGQKSARISKKSLRKLGRMTVAELKQSVKKPEVVDASEIN